MIQKILTHLGLQARHRLGQQRANMPCRWPERNLTPPFEQSFAGLSPRASGSTAIGLVKTQVDRSSLQKSPNRPRSDRAQTGLPVRRIRHGRPGGFCRCTPSPLGSLQVWRGTGTPCQLPAAGHRQLWHIPPSHGLAKGSWAAPGEGQRVLRAPVDLVTAGLLSYPLTAR